MLHNALKTLKSETLWFSYALVVFGAIEMNLGLLKEPLGDYYGISMTVVGVIVAVLRFRTTKPVSDL